MIETQLGTEFSKLSSATPRFFQSPGRINLIGEHTDYNDGFVLPAAINRHVTMAVAINDSDILKLRSADFDEEVSLSIGELLRNEKSSWSNYFIGVLAIFKQRGVKITGVDCVFTSDIPIGAGLSSSAALTCCFAYALNEIYQIGFSKNERARGCMRNGSIACWEWCDGSSHSTQQSCELLTCQRVSPVWFRLVYSFAAPMVVSEETVA